MSIVPMRRLTFCGPASDKRSLVEGLQELGCLHLIPLSAPEDSEDGGGHPTLDEAQRALRYLLDAPYVRATRHRDEAAEVASVVRGVLETKHRERNLIDRRDHLRQQLTALAPWGDFDLPKSEQELGGYKLWFYALPHRQADALDRLSDPWWEVWRSNRYHYVVVLRIEEPPPGLLPVEPVQTEGLGTRSLRRELRETEAAIEDAEMERITMTRHIPLIRRSMARTRDTADLRQALASARDDEGLFALQAWVPAPRAGQVHAFARENDAAAVLEKPGPEDTPPTLLDNPEAVRAGEDLVHFYQVPPPDDWDPSAVLLGSFALFFAIILSDAGYGALVLLLAAWPTPAWRSALGRRMRRMIVALGGASVVFGTLAGSYFGLTPPPDSVLGMVKIVDLRDYTNAMKLSVLIGVLHIALANSAWAAAHWPSSPAVARFGWVVVAAAGYAAWLLSETGNRTQVLMALGVAAAGLLAVILFSSERPVHRPLDVLKRLLDGLLSFTNVTKVFGDVLSYLRLFALGLATMMLATTFNDLAAQAGASMSGFGIFMAIVIIVLGHTLTFVLAVVSGVVHGLRLDYIEFYAWGLSGEGYAFEPLQKRERQT